MIKFLKRSSVRVLLVEKTARLYRNLKDYVTIDELNLEIHFVKENVILSHDSRSSEKSCTESKFSWRRTTSTIFLSKRKKGCSKRPSSRSIRPAHRSL